jgi:signal transduction histidine kinase
MAMRLGRRRRRRAVEEASDERRQVLADLLADLVDRSLEDRRRFAGRLLEQAMAAYASFAALSGACRARAGLQGVAAEATVLVGDELGRQAESLGDLVRAIRPLPGGTGVGSRLATPIAACLAALAGDAPAPRLTVVVDDGLALDWVGETMLLHVAREALDNVSRHARAGAVDVMVDASPDGGVCLRVADDGAGFDPAAVGEGPGISAIRAAVAAVGGTVELESRPGRGTTVTVHIGGLRQPPRRPPASRPHLRLVPTTADAD